MQQTRRFHVLVEWDSDAQVWVTTVPALGFLSDFGATREAALEHTRDAIIGYLEAAKQQGIPVPTAEHPELVEVPVS